MASGRGKTCRAANCTAPFSAFAAEERVAMIMIETVDFPIVDWEPCEPASCRCR